AGLTFTFEDDAFIGDDASAITNTQNANSNQPVTFLSNTYTWLGTNSEDFASADNWDSGVVPGDQIDVSIPDGTFFSPQISSNLAIRSLNIMSGASLFIGFGNLEVKEDLVNNGSMHLEPETSLTLRGVRTGAGTFSVNARVRGEERFQVLSFPLLKTNVLQDPINLGSYLFFKYNNMSQQFVRTTADPAAGEGLFAWTSEQENGGSNVILIILGATMSSGTIDYGVSQGTDDFNLIGNPYLAPVDAAAFFANVNNTANTTGTAYLWNDGGSNVGALRGGDYVTVNSMGAAGGPVDPGNGVAGEKSPSDFDGTFKAFQGFFVEATNDGDITFTPDMQTTGSNSFSGFFRATSDSRPRIRIAMSDGTLYNDILIGWDEHATIGDDYSLDARKLSGNNFLSFYTIGDSGDQYVILAQPMDDMKSQEIKLGYTLAEAGRYEIGLEEVDGIEVGELFLIDHQTGLSYPMVEGVSWAFDMKAGEDQSRFSIAFKPLAVTSAQNDHEVAQMTVFGQSGRLHVRHSATTTYLEVIDMAGKLVHQQQTAPRSIETTLPVSLSPDQVYILRSDNQSVKFIANRP
ncbi:MAG: hypothetical protein AAFO69_17470, partial [Bacteroidota bacterium]